MSVRGYQAGYATNVRHYSHVLQAFSEIYPNVAFLGPSEVEPITLQRLKPVLPSAVSRLLARRVGASLPQGVRRVGSTHSANLPSVKRILTGRAVTPSQILLIHGAQARQVARTLRGTSFLQAVEGLAHIAIRRQSSPVIVVERRNLHHTVFEEPIETFGGFPFRPRPDPIRDLLEEEYAGADRIVVYSAVAKRSFVERGVQPDRVWVSPLPLVPSGRPTRAHGNRNPFQLLYVGRLDAYKGIDVAVATTQLLGDPYRLVVAGPGGEAEREWLSRQTGVEYRGILTRSELTALYESSAALLAPSIESFGLAVLDATMAGVPVLLRETTGVVDYLPADAARVVASRDPEVWAAAVVEGFDGLGGAWGEGSGAELEFSAAVRNQGALVRDLLHPRGEIRA